MNQKWQKGIQNGLISILKLVFRDNFRLISSFNVSTFFFLLVLDYSEKFIEFFSRTVILTDRNCQKVLLVST